MDWINVKTGAVISTDSELGGNWRPAKPAPKKKPVKKQKETEKK